MAKKAKQEKPREYTRRQLSHFKKQKRRQRFIVIAGIVIIAAVIILPLAGWFTTSWYPLHRTMLKVNNTRFSVAEYIDVMKLYGSSQPNSDISTVASDTVQYMVQTAVIKQAAAAMGYTVTGDEIKSHLKNLNLPDTKGNRDYFEAQMLVQKLRDGYFAENITAEAPQVHALMMMVESDQVALEVREKLASGDNFTALAGQYAQDYYAKTVNSGDFGWHVRPVLKQETGTDVPLDYAFSAEPGALSPPLSDNETYKQLGYWLINVVNRPEEGKVEVQALLLSDNATATDIKAKLEAGTVSLADAADQYSQYSLSKQKHGDLGVIDQSDNATFTQAFNGYIFDPETPTGVWSDPIKETTLYTQGGSWLVNVLEKDDNRKVSDEDRNTMINTAFNSWLSGLMSDPNLKIDSDLLTQNLYNFAVDRVSKYLTTIQAQIQ